MCCHSPFAGRKLALHVYFEMRKSSTMPNSDGAKSLAIAFGHESATGLRAVETTALDGTVRYYDLNGSYIGTSLDGEPRGIHIKNGKKVINK